jgi:hypothetical protein
MDKNSGFNASTWPLIFTPFIERIMNHISETISVLFDKGDLPDKVRCTRRDMAGTTYTWSAEHRMYVADDGGEGFMTWYVRRAFGVFFQSIN